MSFRSPLSAFLVFKFIRVVTLTPAMAKVAQIPIRARVNKEFYTEIAVWQDYCSNLYFSTFY